MNTNIPLRICWQANIFMKLNRNISRSCQNLTPASEIYAKLNIPRKIKRGPTDILEALAATVGRDPTAPLYKFHDDPYLYPVSNMEKKTYALSKESGRKSARWIRDTHPELFQHHPDDPIIKDFIPRLQFNEESDVSESDLVHAVETVQVAQAISLYEMCQSKNIVVSRETLQSLLELVSYYNGEETLDEDWTEEARTQYTLKKTHPGKSWKDDGVAEKLFEVLKESEGAAPYCAIIRGMCSYYQIEKAWHLYQEALEKGLPLDTETYNALIRVSSLLKEDNELRWDLTKELLHKMCSLGVPPNLGTLNAVLECLSLIRSWSKSQTLALQAFTEFRLQGVEPSLGTYYHLIKIFYTMRNQRSPILASILDQIEGETFTIRDPSDTMFFFAAMETCKRDLQSFETAERVNKLLETGDNYKFIGESIKEAIYYRNYFVVAVNSLPMDKFMELYSDYVPNKFAPDRDVMEEIIKMLGVIDDVRLIPRLWSDAILGEVARSGKLMEMTLMVIQRHALEALEDQTLKEQLVSVTWDIWNRVQNQNEKLKFKIEWSGQMLGDCLSNLVRCGDAEKAAQIFRELDSNPSILMGAIPVATLNQVLDAFVKDDLFPVAKMVVKYADFHDYAEVEAMAKLSEAPSLPEGMKSKLSSFEAESKV